MKKNILLIATGGTIASGNGLNGLTPVLTSEEIVAKIPEVNKFCNIETIQICNIDSTNISVEIWMELADIIKNNYEKYDGFVICHGTDTMAYSSSAISYLIQNSRKPIVFTGSQRPIHLEDTDARINLYDAILYACDDNSSDVVIVFNGKVIVGTRAKKMKTKSYRAFDSINYPVIAIIQDGYIIRYIDNCKKNIETKFYNKISKDVFLLKITPDMNSDILDIIFDRYNHIILESFGTGGIPDCISDKITTLLKKYGIENKLIIVTTQVIQEGSDMEVYSVGKKVKKESNILEAYDMTLEAVLTKTMWISAMENLSYNEKRKLFYTTVNKDILLKK